VNHLYTGPFKEQISSWCATTGTKTTIAGTEIHDILRAIMVVIAGALMILPAYLNYELFHRLNLDITVSMSISLTSFALGILIFILVVGKEKIEGRKKP
jgi:small-conductance mechanosensitive channel